MKPRLELHNLLLTLCDNVYFQSPESFKLKYPCIKYERSRITTNFGDNNPYINGKLYSLTIIYKHPDYNLPDKIAKLSNCIFDRHYVIDNLYHDVFTISF